jgi:hypothetical protein
VTRIVGRCGLAVLVSMLVAAPRAGAGEGESTADIDRLRAEVGKLEGSIHEMGADLKKEMAYVRDRLSLMIATTFLQSPPTASDVVGVARAAVFNPQIEADISRHRDVLSLRVRRVDATGMRPVPGGDLDVGSGQMMVRLPVDQNGALYVVDWSTGEGDNYTVQLRDGATEQPVATVQVKPLQNRGRFLYVGYRLDPSER